MHFDVLDDVVQVTDRECFIVARNLAKAEGIFTGGSGGGCVSAAPELARTVPARPFVVAVLSHTRMRSLSKGYCGALVRQPRALQSVGPLFPAPLVSAHHRAPERP